MAFGRTPLESWQATQNHLPFSRHAVLRISPHISQLRSWLEEDSDFSQEGSSRLSVAVSLHEADS